MADYGDITLPGLDQYRKDRPATAGKGSHKRGKLLLLGGE